MLRFAFKRLIFSLNVKPFSTLIKYKHTELYRTMYIFLCLCSLHSNMILVVFHAYICTSYIILYVFTKYGNICIWGYSVASKRSLRCNYTISVCCHNTKYIWHMYASRYVYINYNNTKRPDRHVEFTAAYTCIEKVKCSTSDTSTIICIRYDHITIIGDWINHCLHMHAFV